ncbi:uncharacterized protein LOC124812731 [Hydra vulgaris]|uniref:uncharacterized protein LOC124812731 n=1 Tax=Hydra vulgaris TaxID=6087 RepID=UPI001F5EBB48|nr:uncharacterized protein LOC124812731 [Hydra vulgaris]
MAYEPGVLALVQAGEALFHCECATVVFDATTVLDKHVNEFLISTYPPQRCYSLSTAKLAGGTGFDCATHIVSVIKELANTFAGFKNMPAVEVLDVFTQKIKSCLSDRAPVNSCVKNMLQEEMDIQLMQLYCNVHPLETITLKALLALKTIDNELNIKPAKGTDGVAVTVLKNISKLRYSFKGDPAAFKSYLKKNNVAPGLFLRYVGSRFHVLFHMAGIVVTYERLIKIFLENNTKNKNCQLLLQDMSNDITLVQLQGLGLIGKIITGPWMSLVYKNATRKTNLEFGDIFQKAIRKLAYFKSNPESILYKDVDIFSQVLNIKKNKVHQSLCVIKNKNILVKILSALISYTETVLKRQMARYLTGNLSNPSKEMIKTTLSAPPHTMEAERILGMLDFFFASCS